MEETLVIDFPRAKPGRTPRYAIRNMHSASELLHEEEHHEQQITQTLQVPEKVIERIIEKTTIYQDNPETLRKIQDMQDKIERLEVELELAKIPTVNAQLESIELIAPTFIEEVTVGTITETKKSKAKRASGSFFRFCCETIAIGTVTVGLWALVYFFLL